VGYDATSLGGWSAADGKRLWTVKPRLDGDFNVPTPILLDRDRLFVCTENNGARIYRFDNAGKLATEPLATNEHLNPNSHTPVFTDGRLYGVAGGLLCLDASDRLREIWRLDDDALGEYASLIACGRRMLAYTTEAQLLLLEDEGPSCRVLARLSVADGLQGVLSHPALVDTRLYVRAGKQVMCLELDNGAGAVD
jgi:hypothetical protein